MAHRGINPRYRQNFRQDENQVVHRIDDQMVVPNLVLLRENRPPPLQALYPQQRIGGLQVCRANFHLILQLRVGHLQCGCRAPPRRQIVADQPCDRRFFLRRQSPRGRSLHFRLFLQLSLNAARD